MKKGIVGAIALASMTIILVMVALLLVSTPMVLADGTTDNLTTTVEVSSVAPTVGEILCNVSELTPVTGQNTSISCMPP